MMRHRGSLRVGLLTHGFVRDYALLLEGIDFVIDFLIKYPHLAKGKINPVLLT